MGLRAYTNRRHNARLGRLLGHSRIANRVGKGKARNAGKQSWWKRAVHRASGIANKVWKTAKAGASATFGTHGFVQTAIKEGGDTVRTAIRDAGSTTRHLIDETGKTVRSVSHDVETGVVDTTKALSLPLAVGLGGAAILLAIILGRR